MKFSKDTVAPFADLTFRDAPYPLWVHGDVITSLVKHPPERRRRLRLVLEHLASRGRTNNSKACADTVNRGWRREPLGGGGGMQYYLWWSPQTGPHTRNLAFPARSVVVRAIRHHDDHSQLSADSEKGYHSIGTRDIISPTEDALGPTHMTPEQLSFVQDSAPIRVLLGRPGAGKTTALLNAIEARAGQRVLYVTWSDRLCEMARAHATAFAPADTSVEPIAFSTLLSRILGRDVNPPPAEQARTAFNDLLDRIAPAEFGPWAAHRRSVYAEVRAYFCGRAVAADVERPAGRLPRLTTREYERRRGPVVGTAAARRLPTLVSLAERTGSLNDVFPELVAAHEAVSRLRAGHLPADYGQINKIAVDEAQDLTPVEMEVIVELVRAIAHANDGIAPSLIVAGDDGQTVRPSGFVVADLKRHLHELHPTVEHKLHAPLRYPSEIARIIDKAQELYGWLNRELRPTNQSQVSGGNHVQGQVHYVLEPSHDTARHLLAELATKRLESVLIVFAGETLPDWIGEELRQTILLPHEAKGLEYQTVVVLDPGLLLADLRTDTVSDNLRAVELRTGIDLLRVAMTRATETLVFFDVGNSPQQEAESRRLLGRASLDGETVFTTLLAAEGDEMEPGERVQLLVRQSRTIREERPDAGWRWAYHAMELLGHPDTPQGVTDLDLRAEVHQEVCDSAIRLVAKDQSCDQAVIEALKNAAAALTTERKLLPRFPNDVSKIIEGLQRLSASPGSSALEIVRAASYCGEQSAWMQPALASVSETLRAGLDAAAADATLAGSFKSKRVRAWLAVTGHGGDLTAKAHSLRHIALKTLLDAGNTKAADDVHESHDADTPEDHELTGRLRDMQGRHREAAAAYEQAGNSGAAVAAWRKEADWDQAARLSDRIASEQAAELAWLLEASKLARQRPKGLMERLSHAEQDRLAKEFPFATVSLPEQPSVVRGN